MDPPAIPYRLVLVGMGVGLSAVLISSLALRSAGGTAIPCCEFQVLFGALSPKIKCGLQDPNLLYGDGVIWVHHESAELLGPVMKMLCPWGHLGTLSPEQHLLRAAMFLWISVVFFPRVLEARWLQVGFLWFCSVSETQTPLSCQIPHNTAVLAGRELPAINRGSLALHGEHQALLLTWGTPSTEALLRTPLGCARSHPTAVSAWLGQPDLGFGTHSPAVSPHAGNGGGVRGVTKDWGQLWDPWMGCIPPVHWVCPVVGLQPCSETLICRISVSAACPQPGYGVGLRALSCGVWGLSRCVLSTAGINWGQIPNP